MRKFLIATHGAFAKGIKSSLDLIIGEVENLSLIQAYVDANVAIEGEVNAVMATIGANDELIAFTDLLGGSVNNQLMVHALKPNVHIVAGFNLPVLIEILLADTDTPVAEVIETALQNARQQLVYVNKLMSQPANDFDND